MKEYLNTHTHTHTSRQCGTERKVVEQRTAVKEDLKDRAGRGG